MSWLERFLFRGKKRPERWRPVREYKGDVEVEDKAVLNVSSNSYRSLIRVAVSDAERIAADITEKVRSGANAEAARVLAQADFEAEELKRKAAALAWEEANNIISDAENTAASIENEAKNRAFQFLVRESQLIEQDIAREYSLALSKLSANLQTLSRDSEDVNIQLKRKLAMLAENKSLALKEAKTALLGTPEQNGVVEAKPESAIIEEPAIIPETPVITQKPAVKAASIENQAPKKEKTERKSFFSFRGKKVKPALTTAAIPPQPAEVPPQVLNQPASSVVEEAKTPAPAPSPVEESPEPGTPGQAEVESPALLDVDTQTQYYGEVELIIIPPVDLKLVSQLYNYLQTIADLKLLYTRGSWDQGTTIVVALEKPLALVKTVTAIPNLSITVGILEKDAAAGGKTISLLRKKDRTAKRLGLVLKEAVSAPKT